MLRTLVDVLDFALILSFAAVMTVCVLIYLGRKSRSYILLCGYFATQMVLELLVRVGETQSPLAQWCEENLYTAAGVKGMAYSVLMVLMLMSVLALLELPDKPVYFVPVGAICVWLLCLSFLVGASIVMYWAYLLPCELFYCALSLGGLRRLRELKQQGKQRPFDPLLRRVFIVAVVFSCAMVVEDTIASWYYGLFTSGDAVSTLGMAYLKERNYSESLFQLLVSWMVLFQGGRELYTALRGGTQAVPSPEEETTYVSTFAEVIGLSPRERQIFELLLVNKSVQEIAQELYISPGTVKSHAHNIYQKAQVSDRKELIQKTREYEGK